MKAVHLDVDLVAQMGAKKVSKLAAVKAALMDESKVEMLVWKWADLMAESLVEK